MVDMVLAFLQIFLQLDANEMQQNASVCPNLFYFIFIFLNFFIRLAFLNICRWVTRTRQRIPRYLIPS